MRKTCLYSIFCLLVVSSASRTIAQNYTYFNPPIFTPNNLTTTVGINNRPFTGQGGWSESAGTSLGLIQPYNNDGLYQGTQALQTPGNGLYLGAVNEKLINQLTDTAYGQSIWSVQISFAARISSIAPSSPARISVAGFWNDLDADDKFDNNERSFMSGIYSTASSTSPGNSPSTFGILTANNMFRFPNGSGGVTSNIDNALLVPQTGWYGVTTTVTRNANQTDFDLLMSVQVLSTGGSLPMGTFFDFDLISPGIQPFSVTLSSAELGMDRVFNGIPDFLSCTRPEGRPDGVAAMVAGFDSAIDFEFTSFKWNCACSVPEPSSSVVIFACLACLFRRQRK